MNFLVLLGAVGVTLIVVRSPLFGWLRRIWPPLFECAMCSGFWIGLGMGALTQRGVSLDNAISWLLYAGATSAMATLLDFTLAWLDSQTVVVKDDSGGDK